MNELDQRASGHIEDCPGDCETEDRFAQPPGWAVDEAKGQFDDDTPWCVVAARAWELEKEQES